MTLPRNKRIMSSTRREALSGYLFILPTYFLYALFVFLPVLSVIYLSLTRYDIFSLPRFIGLQNFHDLFQDPRLLTVYQNTFYFTFVAVFLNVGIGLLLALALNRTIPAGFNYLFRLAFFLPVIVSTVFLSVIWSALFATDTGIVNYYLGLVGIKPVAWFTDSTTAMTSIILLDVWKNAGFAMVIFLAGLQNIPVQYYEASQLDGAGPWQIFRKVTFPLLSPVIFFNTVIFSIGALQVFDSTKIITDGGPGDSTRSQAMYIYENAFQKFQMGYASTVAVGLLAVIIIITLIQFFLSRRWVHYE